MNNRYKNIVKTAAFAAILILLLLSLSWVFAPSYWYPQKRLQDRNCRIAELSLEKENTIDILNLGDSESVAGFSPIDLWKEYGFTSFNCGADALRMGEAYYVVKLALENQKPKVILMETNMFFRFHLIEEFETDVAQFVYYYFRGLRYHNLWKQPFELEGVKTYYKGYLVNQRITPYEGPENYMDQVLHWTMRTDVPSKTRYEFSQLKKLCEENGIRLILYSIPSSFNYNHPRCDTLAALAQENGLTYLDLNSEPSIVIDWQQDTSDGGDHINLYGARKVSHFFGEYLKENGLAEDHRGDSYYAEWDALVQPFEQLVEEMKGKYFGDIEQERNEALKREKEEKK